jgi:UDP-N-acetylmuramoyl-tripeptide--D-alanyl-D-alanine ligase
MFVALKGDRFDANTFVKEVGKGAAYVIIDNSDYFIDNRTILVLDSLKHCNNYHSTTELFLGLPIIALWK